MLDLLFFFFFLKNKSPAPFSRLSRMLQHGFAVKLQKLFCGNITRLPLGAAGGDKDWVNRPSEPETCHPQTWCLRAPDRFIPNLFSSSHLKLILDSPPPKKKHLFMAPLAYETTHLKSSFLPTLSFTAALGRSSFFICIFPQRWASAGRLSAHRRLLLLQREKKGGPV